MQVQLSDSILSPEIFNEGKSLYYCEYKWQGS